MSIDKYIVMKINEILNEVQIYRYEQKSLEWDQAIAFLKENCSDAIQAFGDKPIFRGSRGLKADSCHYINPVSGKRASENTHNHYTELMDSSPYWKEYPKRSRSLIGSTDYDYANSFGEVFGLYPINGAKIGICPDFDIWSTRLPANKYKISEWDEIPSFLYELGIEADTVTDMKFQIEHEEEITENFKRWAERYGIPEKAYDINTLINDLVELTKPEVTGFGLQTTTAPLPGAGSFEVWFSDPCVAVPNYMIAKILRAINEN
jgi:hypothetical protein